MRGASVHAAAQAMHTSLDYPSVRVAHVELRLPLRSSQIYCSLLKNVDGWVYHVLTVIREDQTSESA